MFIVCELLAMQYSQSQSIVWAARSPELEPGKIEIPNLQIQEIPEDENGEINEDEKSEQTDENGSIVKDQDKASITEENGKELSTTLMGETNLNETKGLTSELKMLKSVEDPVTKFTMLSEVMEKHGKLPPKTTEALKSLLEGDTKAIGELCNILSKHQSTNIGQVDCTTSPDESNDEAIADMVEYAFVGIILEIYDAIIAED